MSLLDEIEQMIGNEYLCNFERIDPKGQPVANIKELSTNFLAQPHANAICYLAD